MTMGKVKVTVIIPNWNGAELMKKHLPYVIEAARGHEVIVVDDASDDGSREFLAREFPGVRVIGKETHEGFSGTVNAGVAHAAGDIVVLLNTDVRPERNFLNFLLPHFDNPDVFAVGCMDRSHEGDKVILRGRGIGRWRKGFFVHERGEVDRMDTSWVSAGSGAFRKSIWKKLGGMDERFNPFYWEDIDLSYRAVREGYKLVFEPRSIVDHYHEAGKIRQEFSGPEVKTITYRNQFMFIWKHVRGMERVSHVFRIPLVLVKAAFRKDTPFIVGFLTAVRRFFLNSPNTG
jgi:GT2 family glycosyltransferase